ncbi:MAG: hypothetical protein FWC50_05700 [Planctomycetaceae bacterium]|nr:hypothetical protein [Planctomycetaceae bacterium]
MGTVPQLWDMDPKTPLDARPFLDRAVVSQPMSAKILRYAEYLIEKYDTNHNGQLEQDEWFGKMSGFPQKIDLDGDSSITLEELAGYIAKYSDLRTIHNPYPLRKLIEDSRLPQNELPKQQFFQPISSQGEKKTETVVTPNRLPVITQTEIDADNQILAKSTKTDQEKSDANPDGTAAATETGEKTEPEYLEGKLPPSSSRKFAAPSQGLPQWFIQRDLNGDGQITLFEFDPTLSNASLVLFGKLDKNGDGVITPDELQK